jgi:uncharacterized protein (DUF1330 family)
MRREEAMKSRVKLIVTLALGIAIGAWGVPILKAQSAGHPAYIVAEVHVTDPAGFQDYLKALPATMAPYHVKTLARGLPDAREGTPPDGQVVLLGFDSLQDANHWYESPEYQKIIPLRQKSATSRVYLVDGVAQ